MSRSVTRDIIGVTDIGLKWEKSVGGVFFGTGVTWYDTIAEFNVDKTFKPVRRRWTIVNSWVNEMR